MRKVSKHPSETLQNVTVPLQPHSVTLCFNWLVEITPQLCTKCCTQVRLSCHVDVLAL